MDCRSFRKQHLAYLDDTLPGNVMAEAQRHIMTCDSCAAHDTMVRRSLMLVHNLSSIEPSAEFRTRMQARLNEAREDSARARFNAAETTAQATSPDWRTSVRHPAIFTALAAGVLVMGTVAWRQLTPREAVVISLKPVLVSEPAIDTTEAMIYLSPGAVQAMATGNPVWPATLLVDDAPAQMQIANTEFIQVKATRE
jgi:anti-sigma factor RsiW